MVRAGMVRADARTSLALETELKGVKNLAVS